MKRVNQKIFVNKPAVFYTASFLQNISYGIIGHLFVVYCLSVNFNPTQIGIVFAAERISTLLFEIPTDGFADQYGGKSLS